MFLSMGHFKMFKPDRKALKKKEEKKVPMEEKNVRNTPVLYLV